MAVTILALCTSSMFIDICIKFREYSFSGFQVIEQTQFVTDRRPGKNNMSHGPKLKEGDIISFVQHIYMYMYDKICVLDSDL